MLARRVSALLWLTSPCTVMPAIVNTGWRSAHHTPLASSSTAKPRNRTEAVAFMSLTSTGMAS